MIILDLLNHHYVAVFFFTKKNSGERTYEKTLFDLRNRTVFRQRGGRVQSQTIPHHVSNNQNLAVADTVKLRIRIRHHTEHARAR